jgi:4-hydroxy-3-polyprenylbenzoate decarboxylase
MKDKKLIIAISGASGAIYGIRTLEVLQDSNIETHLIISRAAKITISQETNYKVSDVEKLADFAYSIDDIGASIASGSFKTSGMLVVPCSIKTMSEISTGITSNLISRAADVILKERRKLVLGLRETPLHLGHMRTMLNLSEMGSIICPPIPAFYPKPQTIDEIINHSVGRFLDLFDIENSLVKRWQGMKS